MRSLVCLCALALTLLVGCQQQPQPPEADSREPPILRFAVAASGEVSGPAQLRAEAGETVKLVLDNQSDQEYLLQLTGFNGAKVFATRVPADDRGQGSAQPRTPGTYTVAIHPVGDPDAGETFRFEVGEA